MKLIKCRSADHYKAFPCAKLRFTIRCGHNEHSKASLNIGYAPKSSFNSINCRLLNIIRYILLSDHLYHKSSYIRADFLKNYKESLSNCLCPKLGTTQRTLQTSLMVRPSVFQIVCQQYKVTGYERLGSKLNDLAAGFLNITRHHCLIDCIPHEINQAQTY